MKLEVKAAPDPISGKHARSVLHPVVLKGVSKTYRLDAVDVPALTDIDLVILPAHEEGRLEHFLYGRGIDSLIRRMPCSILLVRE